MESTARDAFLVVYAVLWAAATPSFGRSRAFSTSAWFAQSPLLRRQSLRRWYWGLAIANVGPLLVLAGVWSLLPPSHVTGWGVLGGGSAGLSVAAFPRFLHAVLASDGRWPRYYAGDQWRDLMEKWDPTTGWTRWVYRWTPVVWV